MCHRRYPKYATWHRILIYIKTRYIFLTGPATRILNLQSWLWPSQQPRGLDLIHRFHCVGSTLPIPWWRETVCEKVFYQYRYRCKPQKPKKEKYLFGIWRILNPDQMLNRPLPILIELWFLLCERLGGPSRTIQNIKHPQMSSHTLVQNAHLYDFNGQKKQIGPWLYCRLILTAWLYLYMVQICSWELISLFCGSIKTWHTYYLFSDTIHQFHYLHCVHYLDRYIIYIIHQISCHMS